MPSFGSTGPGLTDPAGGVLNAKVQLSGSSPVEHKHFPLLYLFRFQLSELKMYPGTNCSEIFSPAEINVIHRFAPSLKTLPILRKLL